MFCMAGYNFSSARVQIGTIDYVKGGSSQWPAAIAYVIVTGIKHYPLQEIILRATGTDLSLYLVRRYRVLFRLDQFEGKWKYLAADSNDGQKYTSELVPKRLAQD